MGTRFAIPLIAAALAGLWGAGLALLHWQGSSSLLDRLEAPLADLRFLIEGPRLAPDGVTILAIDDKTVQQVGAYPLPRATMAQLVSKVGRMQPKAVALDILFIDPGPAEGDLALTKALGETRSVLAVAGLFERNPQHDPASTKSAPNDLPTVQKLLLPIETLASASALGVVNIATDPSGVPRHIPLLVRSGSQIIPSFPLRTVSVAIGRDPVLQDNEVTIGDVVTSTDGGYTLPLRFYGPAGTIRTISASDVLNGQANEDAFRERIVVIGATVTGGGDAFPTPFDPVLPGVEVLATAMAHLIEGDGLVRDGRVRLIDGSAAILLPILFVLLLAWHRGIWGFAIITIVTVTWIGLTFAAFTRGVWLSATLPLLASLPPAMIFGAAELWLDRLRADRLSLQSRTLRRFQPPSLAKRLAEDPSFLMKPVRQKAAVIFIDLSGFTGLSELLPLDETREMLRGFHALVDQEAVRHQGIAASFMGDGAMILFGLPDSSPDDACHAVEACVGLCLRTEEWMAELPDAIASQIGFKIGAHFGEIIASRLGGDSHQHITAIGDTVNVASRLMEVAASHDADVALSDDLHRAAGDACSIFESGLLEGTFPTAIRGRSGSIPIWLWRRESGLSHMRSGSGERHRSPF
ncbi:adenylate/guanylate cyclase domain-containing protein [Microvirga sp. CF3062]|uniref:CHASE2 domain-containing protein n=1 Tax=Microvirga sp. CF3062 TaxID=3110182 RepID=UPI002E767A50|nr:adenylate/guanylate cyclase domain-containing protein [Microvirga sp. CF3062]MEE1657106.1 adenylate/guanylate cyclase domain-containing protein [Microvirga sp. CF3062]